MKTALTACVLLAVTACGEDKPAKAAAPKTVADWFALKVGDKTVRAQIAVLPAEQQRGLMERKDLGNDEGMLFAFTAPQRMSFWMHNTPTPLDIAYFTPEGEFVEVYPGQPFDDRPIPSRSERIQYVLEMNQGWYLSNHVRPGAKLDMKIVTAALEARGFEPRRFGLNQGPAAAGTEAR